MTRLAMALLAVATFLLGGLAINVAVSWWRAAGGSGEPGAVDRSIALRVAEVRRWIDRSPGDRILQYSPSRIGGASGVTRTVIEAEPPLLPQRWHSMTMVEAGWPLPALAGERWRALSSAGDRNRGSIDVPIVMLVDALDAADVLPAAMNVGDAMIPLRPIWPGLANNSVLFAGALWISIVALPRSLRALVRNRRGECGACARPLHHTQLSRCDSCGWLRGISNWRDVVNRTS